MSDLLSSPLSNILNSKEAFEKIKELGFLSYYSDFKLVLCSICRLGLISSAFKGHIQKHIKLYKKEEKFFILSQALEIFNKLEVISLKDSLKLIISYSKNFELSAFKELELRDLYICNLNSDCFMILSSDYSIKRHIRENHNSISSNISSSSSPYKVIKGQALEYNKFFFQIKESSLSINNSLLSNRSRSNSILDDPLERAKEVFLTKFNKKEERFQKELNSFELDSKEKLSPFQIKTRYIEYINKYNIKDLIDLVVPLKEDEKVLEVLVLNLKEVLYLSLDKSIFLNKVHLNILNSFEDNKIRNKPFKPLLNSSTRVKYFNLFSLFIIFFFRALSKSLKEKTSYFKVDNSIIIIYNTLKSLIREKLEEEKDDYLELSNNSYKNKKKSINNKLNSLKLNSIINLNNLEKEEVYSSTSSNSNISSDSIISINNQSSSSKSNSSSNFNSSSNSSSSINYNLDYLLDSSNINILDQIKEINKSSSSISIRIKELLIELLIKLLKQKTDLYIFDSSFNSFFAIISIRAKDKSFKDSLELSQEYSKFIYSIQLIVIEFSFNSLLKDSTLELTTIIKDFRDKYLNNSTNSALNEVLNNRAYCFKVNKETSTQTYISISTTNKETVSYKKITLSSNNLRLLFKELINSTYNILIEKLLLNISKSLYKNITLEEFSKLEDRSLTSPYKCFRDLSPNLEANNNFLKDLIFKNNSLFNRFFKLKDSNLILNKNNIIIYFKDLLEFKKNCLLLVYLINGLPLKGTELITLKYFNSFKNKREIFLNISNNLFIINIS
jgi:Orsellinic acid/F9775 biosynthesis cluster protein D